MRLVKKSSIINAVYNALVAYPVPTNITYAWNLGISAGIMLAVQIITGIILAMYYTPTSDLAFMSVRHIIDDIDFGFMLRMYHASGSSVFFFIVYLHIFRGLYYGSYAYPRQLVWVSGVVILLLMIVTAFIGYVLPWGQMSFWAATVITNLVSVIPFVGTDILIWLWGGFAVDEATLHRFFSLHYLLPFVLLALVLIHIILLHENGSNSTLGINHRIDLVSFNPYFIFKDLFSTLLLLFFFNYYAIKHKPAIIDADNYLEANPLVTPAHIVPEWYFKTFYAILRSVPDKAGGTILLLLSIIVLLVFPYFVKPTINSGAFRPFYKLFFWLFILDFIILAWIGGKPVEDPYYFIGQVATFYYFFYFIFIMPVIVFIENRLYFLRRLF
jgi:quinol-cytochrome oxidoreductase complex cytochrome b subunit